MKTIFLLRHAKSAHPDSDLADSERPLADKGRKAAARLAAYLEKHRIHPELVLCSSARRAVATLDQVAHALRGAPVVMEDLLYEAGSEELLDRLRMVAEGTHSVMLIGHNPAMEKLAKMLIGGGDETLRGRLAGKFPTCAMALLVVPNAPWPSLGAGDATLESFVTPRDLHH